MKTGENGEYSFLDVAPGAYQIVLNVYKAPTADNPYPEQYWPHADKEADASTIKINEAVDSQHCDFRLPVALQSKPVQFIVLLPDGTPAKDLNVNIGTKMNGMFTWVDGETSTDESGRFSFRAVEGLNYTVVDIRTDEAVMASELSFSGSKPGRPITIQLVPKDQ